MSLHVHVLPTHDVIVAPVDAVEPRHGDRLEEDGEEDGVAGRVAIEQLHHVDAALATPHHAIVKKKQ